MSNFYHSDKSLLLGHNRLNQHTTNCVIKCGELKRKQDCYVGQVVQSLLILLNITEATTDNLRHCDTYPYQKVSDREVYQQKGHPVPVPLHEPLPHKVVEGGAVGGQSYDQHDGVGYDGNDLGLPKLHVVRKTKVCSHHHFTCKD